MIFGKGMWIWEMWRLPDPAWIAIMAKDAGFGHVAFKVLDGTYEKEGDFESLCYYLRLEGIQPIAWQYIYQGSVEEANAAIRMCHTLGVDAFIVNAEKEFKVGGMGPAARRYMAALRSGLGDDFTIALSSYRYPSLHPKFPWGPFLEKCDINMPQVYWMKEDEDDAPVENLTKSLAEFKSLYSQLKLSRPILFTGAAFSEHGWVASPAQVHEFLDCVVSLADKESLVFESTNFWEWWEAQAENPELWPVITEYPWRYTPMSEFNEWSNAVTEALRGDGHTIPDPPVTSTPEPESFQVYYDHLVNYRDEPAGNDIGDVEGVVTIHGPTVKKKLQGKMYEWGQISEPTDKTGGWVAIDIGQRV